jgi:hypothetical protein
LSYLQSLNHGRQSDRNTWKVFKNLADPWLSKDVILVGLNMMQQVTTIYIGQISVNIQNQHSLIIVSSQALQYTVSASNSR